MKEEIILIPIDQIRILNPRHRDRRKFELVVESIKTLGLKKPIKVSVRSNQKEGEAPYDLVCGQGRIEAFKALGHTEIPAIVADLPKEERLLMSYKQEAQPIWQQRKASLADDWWKTSP